MAACGDYFVSRRLPTSIRCKAYSEPPIHDCGSYITTLGPGTYFGPVECVEYSPLFITVLVRGYWINVSRWRADGSSVQFAHRVPRSEVDMWRAHGWQDYEPSNALALVSPVADPSGPVLGD